MNPIKPVTTRPLEINVVEPISPALERVKGMLFRPFDLGKWFVIGFCAWLACLGESGGSGFHVPGGSGRSGGGENFRHEFEHAKDYILNNLGWIVPLAAVVVVVGLGLWLLFLWLNSRGKFMFLHCVALDKAEVAKPWSQFAIEGNSLFLFRLGLGLFGWVLTLPLVVIIAVMIFRMVQHGEPDVGGIFGAVGLGLVLITVAVVFAIIHKFTTDFVVPIMFLRRTRCLTAWKELWTLLSFHAGQFILYLLFSIVLAMAIGMMVVMAMIVTCCFCCMMLLPYVGTVVVLPVLVFKRSYSLYFLAQFGREYDVFPPTAPPAPATPPAI
ncbi:MAG: hypothetical protein WBN75_05750 [Verrucomicrobiia bacterium]|jgi:hypothetical protein